MENNKTEQRMDRMEISIKNLESSVETINGHITTIQASIVTIQESIASIPGMIAKAIEELALMTARGFREVHEKMDAYRKETNARFDRMELFSGTRGDMRL